LFFDLSVRVSEPKGGGSPNVLCPYAQGRPDNRSVYLVSVATLLYKFREGDANMRSVSLMVMRAGCSHDHSLLSR